MVTWEYQIPFVIVTLDASCVMHDAVKLLLVSVDRSLFRYATLKRNRLICF